MSKRASQWIRVVIAGAALVGVLVGCRDEIAPVAVASSWARELSSSEAQAPRFVDIGADGSVAVEGRKMTLQDPRDATTLREFFDGGTAVLLRVDPGAPMSAVSSSVELLNDMTSESAHRMPKWFCVSGANPAVPSVLPVPTLRAEDEGLDAKGARILLYFVGTVPPEHDPARPWLVQLTAPGSSELPPPQPMDWAGVLAAAASEPAQSGSLGVWTVLPGAMPWSDFIPTLSAVSDYQPTVLDLRPLR